MDAPIRACPMERPVHGAWTALIGGQPYRWSADALRRSLAPPPTRECVRSRVPSAATPRALRRVAASACRFVGASAARVRGPRDQRPTAGRRLGRRARQPRCGGCRESAAEAALPTSEGPELGVVQPGSDDIADGRTQATDAHCLAPGRFSSCGSCPLATRPRIAAASLRASDKPSGGRSPSRRQRRSTQWRRARRSASSAPSRPRPRRGCGRSSSPGTARDRRRR